MTEGLTSLRLQPAWSLRAELVLRVLRKSASTATRREPRQARRALERLAWLAPRTRRVRRGRGRLGGRPATWLRPRGAQAGGPIILYLHGGGFAFCSANTHRLMMTELAQLTGATVVAPDYRLAPEHPFPAAHIDALAAYRELMRAHADPARVVVAGDSAGGGLALSLLQALRDAGDPLPRGGMLLSPWLDLTCSGATIEQNAPYDYLSREILETFAALYLNGHSPLDPRVSPVFGSFEGLPPLLIQVGGGELLLSESRRAAAAARAAGVHTDLQEWEGMFHAWHGFSLFLPEAHVAFEAIGVYWRELFGEILDTPLLQEPELALAS